MGREGGGGKTTVGELQRGAKLPWCTHYMHLRGGKVGANASRPLNAPLYYNNHTRVPYTLRDSLLNPY